jgi:hypothetical protein
MLTWTELETHVAEKALSRWTHDGKHPVAGGRALYMLPSVFTDFETKAWPASEGENRAHTKERRLAMRAALKRYTLGDQLVIRRDLKELSSPLDGGLKVHMRGYWEFRSQGRREETRLFGFFARPGAFVATAFKGRGEFREGVQADWDAQHAECEANWKTLTSSASYLTDPWPMFTRAQMAVYLENVND